MQAAKKFLEWIGVVNRLSSVHQSIMEHLGMGPIQNCKLDLYQFYIVKFYVMNQNRNQCDPGLDLGTQQNFLATAWHWTVNRIWFSFAKSAMYILVYDATVPVTELHWARTFFPVSLKLAIYTSLIQMCAYWSGTVDTTAILIQFWKQSVSHIPRPHPALERLGIRLSNCWGRPERAPN